VDIVIFGTGELAQVACYQLQHDSEHDVVAFTVHERYISSSACMGLPVIPFEEITRTHPPETVGMFAMTGWKQMNAARMELFEVGKGLGYHFISYVASRAMTWPDLKVGANCFIQDGAMIQPFSEIGDNCQIRAGALIGHHVNIASHCFVGAGAQIGGGSKVEEFCVIGLGSVVRSTKKIARRCFIAAGAVVVSDTEENGVYVGVPAKRGTATVDHLASV
jgi:sugar O-acyltransferase (sialic acid O-acetyltransferase NeuD family)